MLYGGSFRIQIKPKLSRGDDFGEEVDHFPLENVMEDAIVCETWSIDKSLTWQMEHSMPFAKASLMRARVLSVSGLRPFNRSMMNSHARGFIAAPPILLQWQSHLTGQETYRPKSFQE